MTLRPRLLPHPAPSHSLRPTGYRRLPRGRPDGRSASRLPRQDAPFGVGPCRPLRGSTLYGRTLQLVGEEGVEPSPCLADSGFTVRGDLSHYSPHTHKAFTAKSLARQEGFEPPTKGLEDPCSCPLSYCRTTTSGPVGYYANLGRTMQDVSWVARSRLLWRAWRPPDSADI